MAQIRWLGHAAFHIETDGKSIYIDPWLTGNPKAAIKRDQITKADIVLISHDHDDHGLTDGIEIAKGTNATLLGIFEVASYASSQGASKAIGMNIGGTSQVGGIRITLVPAIHSANRGTPTGFVIRSKETSIYHAGDTAVFQDMALIGKLYKPKVALLPIGGHFTMGPEEAAVAVSFVKPSLVIPMHYNTFPVINGDPKEFQKLVKKQAKNVKVVIISPGQSHKL